MKANILVVVCLLVAITANAGPPSGIYPKDLEGLELTWQSRASMRLAERCEGNKCDQFGLVPGSVFLLGAAYWFGHDTVYLVFTESCEWDGELCVPLVSEQTKVVALLYEVTLVWDANAGAYLRVLDTDEGHADFEALTMDTEDAGRLQIGAFDIKGNGKVYHYDRDVTRDVWQFERWWPPMPPDPGPV